MERHPNNAPCSLGPPEAFSNELAPDGLAAEVQPHHAPRTGRHSSTVTGVFASRCCGYRDPPTAAELHDAMRRSTPTERDRTVLTAWVVEASEREWLLAWTEQAYSWRMLIKAVETSKWPCWSRIRNLNMLAARPELIPKGSFPTD